MLTRSQRWIREDENCFLPLLVPWPELGWPVILGPNLFLSKPTCVSLHCAFFPLQCTVILIMNALLHDMENVKRADPKRRQYTSAGAKGSPSVSYCPALFALGGQRQTVWAVIKTVCLVWPAQSPRATVTLCLYPRPWSGLFNLLLIATLCCFPCHSLNSIIGEFEI